MKTDVAKKYKLVIVTPPTCMKRDEVLSQMEMYKEGSIVQTDSEGLPIKSVLGKDTALGKWCLYLNKKNGGNDDMYGQIRALSENDESLSSAEMEKILSDAETKDNYSIVINDKDGRKLLGELLIWERKAQTEARNKATSDLDDLIKSKVRDGILTQSEVTEILEYLQKNRVDTFLTFRIVKGYKSHKKRPCKPGCLWVDPFLDETSGEGTVAKILRRAVSGYGLLLEGDKSVGKNVLAETIAWLLWKPWYSMTMNEQMTMDAYFGDKTTDNSASMGIRDYDMTILGKKETLVKKQQLFFEAYSRERNVDEAYALTYGNDDFFTQEEKAVLKEASEWERLKAQGATVQIITEDSALVLCNEDAGVLIADEMNLADPNTNASVFNPLLDGRARMFVKGRGDMVINPDMVVIGTQNPDYEGCLAQNDAMLSRMGKFVLVQPSSIKPQLMASVEAAVTKAGFNWKDVKLPADYFKQAERFYKECYKAATKETPSLSAACLNIRGFVRAMSIVAESNGVSQLKDELEIEVVNPCPSDEYVALKALLSRTVQL